MAHHTDPPENSKRTSRLAPSPTGALHLGNARTFLINWALARRNGWNLLMRIEDLDGPRIKQEAARQAIDILDWLGIDWDDEPTFQTHDLSQYESAMQRLADQHMTYTCDLSRAEIEAVASAPHDDDGETCYPAELRPDPAADPSRFAFDSRTTNYRFVVSEERVEIADVIAGRRAFTPHQETGDFVIWTRRGTPAYQLAVVVDDGQSHVTDVVRGDDLLASAARQELLYRALQLPPPRWWHLPLVVGEDGRRLAKRHGDTRIGTYRDHGVTPQRIIGLLAYWSGACEERTEMNATDFLDTFNIERLPEQSIVFRQEDHQWLIDG